MEKQAIIDALDEMTEAQALEFHGLSTTTNVDDTNPVGSGFGGIVADVATAMDAQSSEERAEIKEAVQKIISENPGGDPGT